MPKIAIIHEWLTSFAGSERVLEQLLLLYPEADLFAVADFLAPADRHFLHGRQPRTTFLQRAPFARRHLRQYLGLMPLAIEGLDLRGYDIVISSSHAVAKGVLTGPDQFHLCYCHSPIRYAWDMQAQYLELSGLTGGVRRAFARALLHYMRLWDARTANGVNLFVVNSHYIARRIRKTYGREALVLHPPVDVDAFTPRASKDRYYICVARLVPYKRADLVVEAFARMPERRLVVVGDGPLAALCRRKAGPNVEFRGALTSAELRPLMENARALVFAAEEDFGITIAESLASATPVICYGRGGATEIVEEDATGIFFEEQTPESLIAAVDRFECSEHLLDRVLMRASVERFHPRQFRREFDELLQAGLVHARA
jgi:glycosyltransferase involved in cell wall biosynthesis